MSKTPTARTVEGSFPGSSYSPSLKRSGDPKFFESKKAFYKLKIGEIMDQVKKLKKSDWNSQKQGKLVVSTAKVPGSKYLCIKGEYEFSTDASPDEFIKFVDAINSNPSMDDIRKEVDPTNIFYQKLSKFDPDSYLFHLRVTAKNRFVTDRDFIILRTCKFGKNAATMFGGSFKIDEDDVNYPIDSKCVRGWISGLCYICHKRDMGLKVTYYSHVEPLGSIPAVISNAVVKKKAVAIVRIVDAFLRERKNKPKFMLDSVVDEPKEEIPYKNKEEVDNKKKEEKNEKKVDDLEVVKEDDGEVELTSEADVEERLLKMKKKYHELKCESTDLREDNDKLKKKLKNTQFGSIGMSVAGFALGFGVLYFMKYLKK